MPIPPDKINTAWIDLPKTTTIREIRDRVPRDQRRIQWIVTPISGQEYAVYRISDLIEFMHKSMRLDFVTNTILNQTLEQLPGFLKMYTRVAIDQGANWHNVSENWKPISDPPLVVLQGGVPIGILKGSVRSGASDIDLLENEAKSANGGSSHPPLPTTGGGSEDEPPSPVRVEAHPKGAEFEPGTLGVDEVNPPAPPPPPPPTPPPAPSSPRFITAALQDHEIGTPLQVGETYTVAFGIETDQAVAALADAKTLFNEGGLFPEGVDQIQLTVQLVSNDFIIHTEAQKIIVPRTGKSKNKARFDFEPKKNGAGEITAIFLKDGNAFQVMTLKLNVGVSAKPGISDSESVGRSVEQGVTVKPRDLTLLIKFNGTNFNVNVIAGGVMEATLPITPPELDRAIQTARQALLDIVNYKANEQLVYQAKIDIPADVNQQVLRKLAAAGYDLFQAIFMHPGIDNDGMELVQFLRSQAQKEFLKIQIVSQQMMLPWGMLYLAEQFDETQVQPEHFLGFKHIIEHTPMQRSMNFPLNIPSQPKLAVSLNLNPEIDSAMHASYIEKQKKYWSDVQSKSGINVVTRTTRQSFLDAMKDANTPDQITYFYCHAVSRALAERVNTTTTVDPNASLLKLGETEVITLQDLNRSAPITTRLSAAPLFFINACESAELSPLFYNGFMPYFVSKGARGMIGTECTMPALFAADWASKFFDQFLAGKSIGEIFLGLRREYYFTHNNPLGLLYALYCDADTSIAPALQ